MNKTEKHLRQEICSDKLTFHGKEFLRICDEIEDLAGRFAVADYHIDGWFLELMIDLKKEEKRKTETKINKWTFKKKILEGKKIKESVDLELIRAIPIRNILNAYNISIENNKFKLRNEKTPSCWLYESQNRYWDYGANEGGSVIDLVMKITKCDVKKAINELKQYL